MVIDAHRILPGPEVIYRLTINASSTVTAENELEFAKQVIKKSTTPKGPGWYRGDLHAHSRHSDAAWDLADLIAFAEQQKLDFVTLSDHNTISRPCRIPDLPQLSS